MPGRLDPHGPRLSQAGRPVSRHHDLLGDARAFRRASEELVHPYAGRRVGRIAGVEARGFILGGAMAQSGRLNPDPQEGRLPHATVRVTYSLEHGAGRMEIHRDAVEAGEEVVLVDDLIATGSTAEGAVRLLRQIGAEIVAACFVIELPDLGGRAKLEQLRMPVRTLIAFEGR